jgi:protein-disulfide isomerase
MMKNRINKYGIWVLLLVLGSSFAYREWEKSKKTLTSNPFLDYKSESDKKENQSSSELIILENKSYNLENLPRAVQFELLKEKIHYYDRQKIILKDFATRAYISHQSNANMPIEEIPNLASFVSSDISKEEIEKYISKNKSKYPAESTIDYLQSQAKYELIIQKALSFYSTTLKKIYETNNLKIKIPTPQIPLEWLDTKDFPNLGSLKAKNHLIVLANYVCPSCTILNDELAKLYTKYGPDELVITFIPYGNFVKNEDYLTQSAMCVFQQDLNLFWKYHIVLINEIQKLVNKSSEIDYSKLNSWAKNEAIKLGANKSKLESCLAPQNPSIINLYSKINSSFKFLDTLDIPIYILNDSKLDLDGRSLLSAYEEKMNQ